MRNIFRRFVDCFTQWLILLTYGYGEVFWALLAANATADEYHLIHIVALTTEEHEAQLIEHYLEKARKMYITFIDKLELATNNEE